MRILRVALVMLIAIAVLTVSSTSQPVLGDYVGVQLSAAGHGVDQGSLRQLPAKPGFAFARYGVGMALSLDHSGLQVYLLVRIAGGEPKSDDQLSTNFEGEL